MSRYLLLVCALLACSALAAQAQSNVTYAQLDPFKDQWDIQVHLTKDSDKNVFTKQSCNETSISAPCNIPGMRPDAGDKVKVVFSVNGKLKTLNDAPAKTATLRFCFTRPFIADRPWRKFNAVVEKDKSCPIKVATVDLTSNATNTFDKVWSLGSKMDLATASFFTQVLVQCETPDGKLDWCQADSTSTSSIWASQKIDSISPAMRILVVVCALVGPAFMVGYFIIDHYFKKQQ